MPTDPQELFLEHSNVLKKLNGSKFEPLAMFRDALSLIAERLTSFAFGVAFTIVLEFFFVLYLVLKIFRKSFSSKNPKLEAHEGDFSREQKINLTNVSFSVNQEKNWANIAKGLSRNITPNKGDSINDNVLNQKSSSTSPLKDDSFTFFFGGWLSKGESCSWLNIFLSRYWLLLLEDKEFIDDMKVKLSKIVYSKIKSNSLVGGVEVTNVDVGGNVPTLSSIKCVKGVCNDMTVTVEVNISYLGGASVEFEASTFGSLKFSGYIIISGFTGTLRVCCPAPGHMNSIAIGFIEDPGVEFTIKLQSQILRDNELVLKAFSKLLRMALKKAFVDLLVLPHWYDVRLPLIKSESATSAKFRQCLSSKKNLSARKLNTDLKVSSKVTENIDRHIKNIKYVSDVYTKLLSLGGDSSHPGDIFAKPDKLDNTIWDSDSDIINLFEYAIILCITNLLSAKISKKSLHDSVFGSYKCIDNAILQRLEDLIIPTVLHFSWKLVRKKGSVFLHKLNHKIDNENLCVYRSLQILPYNAETTFEYFCGMENGFCFRDFYIGSDVVHKFDDNHSIIRIKCNGGGQRRFLLYLMEIKRKISADSLVLRGIINKTHTSSLETEEDYAYVISYRSVDPTLYSNISDLNNNDSQDCILDSSEKPHNPDDKYSGSLPKTVPEKSTNQNLKEEHEGVKSHEARNVEQSDQPPNNPVDIPETEYGMSYVYIYAYYIFPVRCSADNSVGSCIVVISSHSREAEFLNLSLSASKKLGQDINRKLLREDNIQKMNHDPSQLGLHSFYKKGNMQNAKKNNFNSYSESQKESNRIISKTKDAINSGMCYILSKSSTKIPDKSKIKSLASKVFGSSVSKRALSTKCTINTNTYESLPNMANESSFHTNELPQHKRATESSIDSDDLSPNYNPENIKPHEGYRPPTPLNTKSDYDDADEATNNFYVFSKSADFTNKKELSYVNIQDGEKDVSTEVASTSTTGGPSVKINNASEKPITNVKRYVREKLRLDNLNTNSKIKNTLRQSHNAESSEQETSSKNAGAKDIKTTVQVSKIYSADLTELYPENVNLLFLKVQVPQMHNRLEVRSLLFTWNIYLDNDSFGELDIYHCTENQNFISGRTISNMNQSFDTNLNNFPRVRRILHKVPICSNPQNKCGSGGFFYLEPSWLSNAIIFILRNTDYLGDPLKASVKFKFQPTEVFRSVGHDKSCMPSDQPLNITKWNMNIVIKPQSSFEFAVSFKRIEEFDKILLRIYSKNKISATIDSKLVTDNQIDYCNSTLKSCFAAYKTKGSSIITLAGGLCEPMAIETVKNPNIEASSLLSCGSNRPMISEESRNCIEFGSKPLTRSKSIPPSVNSNTPLRKLSGFMVEDTIDDKQFGKYRLKMLVKDICNVKRSKSGCSSSDDKFEHAKPEEKPDSRECKCFTRLGNEEQPHFLQDFKSCKFFNITNDVKDMSLEYEKTIAFRSCSDKNLKIGINNSKGIYMSKCVLEILLLK